MRRPASLLQVKDLKQGRGVTKISSDATDSHAKSPPVNAKFLNTKKRTAEIRERKQREKAQQHEVENGEPSLDDVVSEEV